MDEKSMTAPPEGGRFQLRSCRIRMEPQVRLLEPRHWLTGDSMARGVERSSPCLSPSSTPEARSISASTTALFNEGAG